MITWENIEPPEPFIGPPKPVSCPAGWTSHSWLLCIEEGQIGLSTKECNLCNDGVHDLEPDYLNGEMPVQLHFHKEHYYSGDVDVWWEIAAPDKETS